MTQMPVGFLMMAHVVSACLLEQGRKERSPNTKRKSKKEKQ